MSYQHILVDDPRPRVRRITLNRPEKRNALNNRLRGEIFEVLEAADRDADVSITILRGAGPCFSAGYDLSANNSVEQPYHSAAGPGQWSRHVVEGWFSIWDLAKPVIAQVHGYCLAGGTELATACDVVYVADDAQIGYPPVRLMSPPDMQYHPWLVGMRRAMEMMVTGDSIRDMCVQRVNASVIRKQALKEGMITLRQDGWRKVLQGKTTLDEVARVTAGDIIA